MAKNTFRHIGIRGHRYGVGTGYIIIPNDVDRDLYVTKSLRTCKVGILTENNEVVWGVRISKRHLQEIEFPEKSTEIGSAVLFVTLHKKNKPVIVCPLLKEDESYMIEENEFLIEKIVEDGLIQISGNALTGQLVLSASHKTLASLNLFAKGEDAEINLNTNGNITFTSEGEVIVKTRDSISITVTDPNTPNSTSTITYTRGTGFSYSDEFGNTIDIGPTGAVIDAIKTNLGDSTGTESMVKGLTFLPEIVKNQVFLTTLKTAIQAAPVTPQDGGATFKAALVASISALQIGDFSNILSTKHFIDE
jgi:hypothetical protein